jgi:hypothetical protein
MDFLNDIASIFPKNTAYYPIPTPDHPIINYLTIPP